MGATSTNSGETTTSGTEWAVLSWSNCSKNESKSNNSEIGCAFPMLLHVVALVVAAEARASVGNLETATACEIVAGVGAIRRVGGASPNFTGARRRSAYFC